MMLDADFKKTDPKNEMWLEKRNKKGNIYIAIKEYLSVLEKELELEDDSYNKHLINQEIKKMKKELDKYYVPTILETAKFERYDEQNKEALEKSSFLLVKKIRG